MFGTLLGKATGWLDQRLVSTVLLPSLAFWAGIGALVATHRGWAKTTSWWNHLDGARKLLLAGGALTALLVFALLMQIALPTLTRIYEGYWRWDWLGAPGKAIQRARWKHLNLTVPREFTRRYREFPPLPAKVMPTRVGNALRAAEGYAADRYGLDAVFFWPRLYPLLPDALRDSLSAARASLEQMLLTSALSGVLAIVIAVFAATLRLPLVVWLPVLVGTLVLSLLTYRAAVTVALSYGELVRAAFDTHRRALLTSMGHDLPTSPEDEHAVWTTIGQRLYRGDVDKPQQPADGGTAADQENITVSPSPAQPSSHQGSA
jgi:hypothetical protein